MGVEIVHHHHHLVGVRIVLGEQFLHEERPVFLGASPAHFEVALACQRLTGDEHVACSFLFVGIILSPGLTRLHVLWRMLVFDQVLAHFIHAKQRAAWVVGSTIDIQDIFHMPHKLSSGLGKAPLLLQPRLEFVFFNTWRMVS